MDRLDAKRDAPMEANVDLDRLRDTEYIQTMTLVSEPGGLPRPVAPRGGPRPEGVPRAPPPFPPGPQRNIRSPTITFIKLRPDANRTMEDAEALGKSWTEFARSGQVSAQFYGAGPDQLVVVVEDGAAAVKLRDFILSQPEAYEWEVERQQFRRAGDPPFDQLPEVAAERRERERLDEVRRNTAAWRRRQGDGGGGAAGEL